jgi:hypothetical protein
MHAVGCDADFVEDGVDESEIFNVLDDLGLAYDRRTSARGVPYAGFRLVGTPDSAGAAARSGAAVTAIVEHGVFRLTSHGIDTAASAIEIVRAGARLPLGAAYRSPDDGSAELSVAVFIGEATLSSAIVSRLLDYLVVASAALSKGDAPPARPTLADADRSAADIRAALSELGHQLTPEGDGYRMAVPLGEALACSIVVRADAAGWISASANYVPEQQLPPGEDAMRTLQKLQRWAAAGRFVLDETTRLRADVATPLLGYAASRSILWTVSQSVAMLQTAARHLGLIS